MSFLGGKGLRKKELVKSNLEWMRELNVAYLPITFIPVAMTSKMKRVPWPRDIEINMMLSVMRH